ncbi:MAG TPA: carboxypeptidase-like regulatory domain-containing protein, partial [Prolixibacteraceae bacterium]
MKQKNLFFLPKGKWTRMLLSAVLLMVLTTGMAFAQQKTITGKVTDKSGSSIPGASIVVQGTAVGTVTDGEGKYNLKVPSNSNVLLFSFIGMKSVSETINNRSVINVVLEEEAIAVGEVVAIGYGTQTKREISGSVTNVSAKD